MKKFLALFLAILMIVSCFAGCGETKKDEETKNDTSTEDTVATLDSEYVTNKGTLVVGMTEFAPMDYKDEDGNWIGFDADMATAFAKSLGVKVEFVEIDWDNKVFELNGKSIDCVWNGMTLTDEVKSAMATSNPYFNNAQVVIVKKDKADKYQTAENCKDLVFAVEAGSAGKDMAVENGFEYTEVKDQASALFEVKSGTSDAAIIDYLMASAMVGEGTAYDDLTYTASLNSEEYGVGFRKNSDLAEKLNEFFVDSYANGTMKATAEKYNIADKLIEQK